MRTTEKVVWLIAGALIGAAVALLYAPQSGQETRKYLRRKAEDARDTIAETGGQVRDTLAETGESIAKAGRRVYSKGAAAVEGASELIDRGRRRVEL